jgi:ATP-dependent Lon protease
LKDLIDVPKKVRDDLAIVAVSHMDQIIDVALHPHAAEGKPVRQKRSASQKTTEAKGDERTVPGDQAN